MPRGIPSIGSMFGSGAQVLGTVRDEITADAPPEETTFGAEVTMTEPPPPWELAQSGYALSDARRFVSVPDNIEVRWINPKVLDAEGWRDWQPVMASDKRFTVNVATMISPEGNIRRGGPTGDILAWMYKAWVVSRRKQFAEATEAQTLKMRQSQHQLKEDFQRNKYGPYTRLDSAAHPDGAILDGKALPKD